jgi:fucose permease
MGIGNMNRLMIYRPHSLASLGHANWILRHYEYRPVFIWGLCLYGIGALIAWPCILHQSFGSFCAAMFILGNGLGSLETAANPYITSKSYSVFKFSVEIRENELLMYRCVVCGPP